jgi:hypothetical protein
MSYEATISSYGGNTAVMAKSFVMAVKSVAQTWYSSLRPGTITSWQKLKDMLITSFQGFQTKPVTALSFIPVHPGPRRIPSGVCPKVPASEGTGANGAQ